MSRRWFRYLLGAAEDPKFYEIADDTGQPVSVVAHVWLLVLDSAAARAAADRRSGGAFDVGASQLATKTRHNRDGVRTILAAFEAIGMTNGGVVAKWEAIQSAGDDEAERKREQRARQAEEAARRAAPEAAPARELPLFAPEAAPAGAPMSRTCPEMSRTCPTLSPDASRAEESDSDSETESSSVVVPFAPREAAQRAADDDEILFLNLKRIFSGKASAKAIRAAAPMMAGWIRDGCDLSADLLPELVEIAARLRKPLNSFAAPFVRRQVFARRDVRLAGGEARAPPAVAARPRPPPAPALAPVSAESCAQVARMAHEAMAAIDAAAAEREAKREAERSAAARRAAEVRAAIVRATRAARA